MSGHMAESWDNTTRETVKKIPLLTENAGPGDAKEKWDARLKQELQALIQYIQMNKESDTDWLPLQPSVGKRWTGKCCPHFGFAHALCLGLAPWMAAEVPYMVEAGVIKAKV
eukprot:jgi/Chrzof1/11285/Cz05g31030.t1